MTMKLLKNKKEWRKWKREEGLEDDEAQVPDQFPCYAYIVVTSWMNETVKALYKSEKDISEMLSNVQLE